MQREIVIVGLTRMGSLTCAGALDCESGVSYRLMETGGRPYFVADAPVQVGSRLLADVLGPAVHLKQPHVEDVRIGTIRDHGVMQRVELARFIVRTSQAPVWRGNISHIFDGRLVVAGRHAAGCLGNGPLPKCSTGFWIPDQPLHRIAYDQSVSFETPMLDGHLVHLKHVGVEQAPDDDIPAGALLRVSLSRWWAPDERDEACYLQLSGMIHSGFGVQTI